MANVRKRHTAEFKAKVALEAIRQQKTANELTTEYGYAFRLLWELLGRTGEPTWPKAIASGAEPTTTPQAGF